MKLMFSATILCTFALTGCSDGRNGLRMTSPEGHFTAWFPSEPKHKLPSGDLVHQYTAEVSNGAIAFLIRYTPQADSKISLDRRLVMTQNVMKSKNVKVVPVTMCGSDAKEMSHEYVYDGVRYHSRQRMFYVKDGLYQMIVTAQSSHSFPEADAARFYSGFQLLEP
jgi:hypothetical protein